MRDFMTVVLEGRHGKKMPVLLTGVPRARRTVARVLVAIRTVIENRLAAGFGDY